ncbi:DISARM system SNF2-like helicase DrmD [Rhodococcus aetherivorans]|uniref:DISARM system SNF2-like helicase DrmD n=1 Tax=Rhodococcus aetherivorans TaxID=191292 RepID=UPI00368EF94D
MSPAVALQAVYGARPTVEFVREAWPTLRESWLRTTKESREWVVEALKEARGDKGILRGSRAQMAYLRELRNSRTLREIVWAELIATGEMDRPLEHEEEATQKSSTHAPARPHETHRASRAWTGDGDIKEDAGLTARTESPSSRDTGKWVADVSTALGSAELPALGQLARVRGRHWVVTDVVPTALPFDIKSTTVGEGQTLVTLSSVEDDGLGEELRVLWELEAGRRILDAATLPDLSRGKFDEPATLGAFLDALRWGAVTNAETTVLQAPFRAGIAIEDYQLEPVTRALTMPRVNLLVADDVGLGKTIEAGLVVQELLLRQRARRVMIVCPAPLTIKWQEEMATRFGLDFHIVDTAEVRRVRRDRGLHANPFRVYPHTIVSLPWLRGARCQRLLAEVLDDGGPTQPRAIDLLVVDEAHHCAPPGRGKYAVDSLQTRAVARLSAHSEHRLFLTATPHNGYAESWTALLAMLDPQRFARGVPPDPAALKQALIRRLKSELTNPDGTPRYPERLVEEITVDYPTHEQEVHALLRDYTAARQKRLARESFRGAGQAADLVTLLLKKRLFSSPAAFARTMTLHLRSVRGAGAALDIDSDWLGERQAELVYGDWSIDEALNDAEDAAAEAATMAAGQPGAAEQDLLDKLETWVHEHGVDSDAKARALIDYLEKVCKTDGRWNDERVVIFTEYRDTQRWLKDLLEKYDLAEGGRLELLYGGMDEEQRERIKGDFQKPPHMHPVRIVLATDTASEGIDLQDHCHRLVNYDIPFNPNRLEQRAGRIDRYGQSHRPQILHFVGAQWKSAPPESAEADLDFLFRVAVKVATMREDLGSVNPVLAAAVERRMLGRPDRAFRVEAVQPKSATRDALKVERNLRAEADRLRAALAESAQELHSTPGDVERVVRMGLQLGRQSALQPVTDAQTGQTVWRVPPLTGSWSRTIVDLVDRDYGARPISFDASLAAHRDDVVLAHLNHPLVAMATRLLRAEVWGAGHLERAASLVVDDPHLSDPVLAAYSRLVLVGADGKRLHEELFPAGGRIRGASFSRLGVTALAALLDTALGPASSPLESSRADKEELVRNWSKLSGSLEAAITARAKERELSLEKLLAKRQADEETRTAALLSGFEKSLRDALAGQDQAQQLSFADLEPDERDQLTADRSAWRQRLDSLPTEREAALASIARRYTSVQVLWFPAAVVHLVPARRIR